jgi:hypothetical protein
MAINCPSCGRQHDITLFEFGRTIRCACGRLIDASHIEPFRSLEQLLGRIEDGERAEELKKMADRVCRMILDEGAADVDIEIAWSAVREKCRELFPRKLSLFEMIYESRFRRLWEQFRGKR